LSTLRFLRGAIPGSGESHRRLRRRWKDGGSLESQPERFNSRERVLPHGGYVTSRPAEGLSPFEAPETATDLLLEFGHPEIAFGEVVIKIYGEVTSKGQHPFFVFPEALEQVPRYRFLLPATHQGTLATMGLAERPLSTISSYLFEDCVAKRFVRWE